MHSLIAYYLSYMMLSDQLNTLSGLLVVEGRNVLLFNAWYHWFSRWCYSTIYWWNVAIVV